MWSDRKSISRPVRALAYIRPRLLRLVLRRLPKPPLGATNQKEAHAGCEPSTRCKQHACRFAAQAIRASALRSGTGRIDFRRGAVRTGEADPLCLLSRRLARLLADAGERPS